MKIAQQRRGGPAARSRERGYTVVAGKKGAVKEQIGPASKYAQDVGRAQGDRDAVLVRSIKSQKCRPQSKLYKGRRKLSKVRKGGRKFVNFWKSSVLGGGLVA